MNEFFGKANYEYLLEQMGEIERISIGAMWITGNSQAHTHGTYFYQQMSTVFYELMSTIPLIPLHKLGIAAAEVFVIYFAGAGHEFVGKG